MVRPLDKRMLVERTMLERKHSFTQEMPNSLSLSLEALYKLTRLVFIFETMFFNQNENEAFMM